MNPPSLIVSLHDVTASTFSRVQLQVQHLKEWGVSKTSLLVVPHYHQKEQLDEDKPLCQWLRDCEDQQHEIVLHGWNHRNTSPSETSSKKNPFSRWFYENLYTSGEAEFLNQSREEAGGNIRKGLDLLRSLNLHPQGFIAPAWLMNPGVERAIADHGLLYSNTISEIILFPEGRRHPTRSCVWSTRAGWRRTGSLIWNHLLFQKLKTVDPLRISLHPCDLDHPKIWAQIEKLIRNACQSRNCTTYADWSKIQQNQNLTES